MNAREHINLLIFLVEQLLQLAHLCLQESYALLQRLGISSWEGATAQLVAGLAFESDVGALRATGADSVAAYFLGATSVAGLGDAGLATLPDFDYLHRQYSRHDGGSTSIAASVGCSFSLAAPRGLLTGRYATCHPVFRQMGG